MPEKTKYQLINGYVEVRYDPLELKDFIVLTDKKTGNEISFHESVIPIIAETLKKNHRKG